MTDYADWTKNLIADIRANGRPTSGYFEGRPVMVLTTTGAKSGQPRTAVVTFSRDGDDYVVVGSKSGEPEDPAWFTNLVANPVVTVEADGKTLPGPRDGRGRRRPRRALGPARRGTPPVRRLPVKDRPDHPDRPAHAARLTRVRGGADGGDEEQPNGNGCPPRWFIRIAWAAHRAITRLTGGRRGLWLARPGKWGTMRLTTVGRKTGKTRSAILGYYEDGPNLVTMAMNGWGAPEPAWWLNLQAQPNVEVELKTGTRAVRARAAEGEERERLWARWREFGSDPDAYADRRPGADRGRGARAGCGGRTARPGRGHRLTVAAVTTRATVSCRRSPSGSVSAGHPDRTAPCRSCPGGRTPATGRSGRSCTAAGRRSGRSDPRPCPLWLEGPALVPEELGDVSNDVMIGERLGATLDDDIERWERRAAGRDGASTIRGDVPCLLRPLPRHDVHRAIDPEGDHGHQVRSTIRSCRRQPAGPRLLGVREACRATSQDDVSASSPSSDCVRAGARSCVIVASFQRP